MSSKILLSYCHNTMLPLQRKISLTLILFIAIAGQALAGIKPDIKNKKTRNDDKQTLHNLQAGYFENIKNKNLQALDNLISEDYSGIYALGIIDKAKELKDIEAFSKVLTDYKIKDEKITLPDPKTGLVTFRLAVTVTVNGRAFSEENNVLCVWIKKKNKWFLYSQSAVKVSKK